MHLCFLFNVLSHESITDDIINHQSLTPPPHPSLCHIFLLSHSQTRYSVKAFKVTYIQPLSFPSHSVGGVGWGGGWWWWWWGCILIWFFPQTITPYLSLWTHLEVILLLISKTTQRNVKAGVWTRRWCLCSARLGRKEGLAYAFIMHHCLLPPPTTHYPNTYVCTQAHYSQTGTAWTPEALQRQRGWLFDSVSVELASLLLTSETLSHHWSCDLTLPKSFAQAAMHCWVLKVSSL